ncbi:DUF817 domain-containing protein [Acetobacteraceae bacterium KSS8]|uniref:DUF817 domain-containing protein n=1 Tax=Endosaccharibacter trunci TaxID=2812733 RepID=A0ABT1W602_9PROT|nr:DUF817 domain-containing protein [Acetobacteraceae bacterium KSS8]
MLQRHRPSAATRWPVLAGFVAWEERLGLRAQARGRFAAASYEFLRFGIKQGWACLFGGLLLALLIATRLWYPHHAPVTRYDALVLGAVLIQIVLLLLRMETLSEARVILLFHALGTSMEVFKTHVGSWIYPEPSLLRIGGVPLFTGFMYGAVGSYLVRAWHLFALRFERYPFLFSVLALAAAIYANFFADHWRIDLRYPLILATAMLFGRTIVFFTVWRTPRSMPLLLGFGLVALFIWFAENIGTGVGAWIYPNQRAGWTMVPISKLSSWFLLMLVSFATVSAQLGAIPFGPRRPHPPARLARLGMAAFLLSCGLAWALWPHDVPRFWFHAVGSVLWGGMVLCLVAASRRDGRAGAGAIAASIGIAFLVELSRLVRWAPLDAFRHTMPGVLLLGRVFDPLNLVLYTGGIFAASFWPPVSVTVRIGAAHDANHHRHRSRSG